MSDVDAVIAKLENPHRATEPYQSLGELCPEAAALIRSLAGALEPFAKRKISAESLINPPREWLDAPVERRIEMMGGRRRDNDAAILAARRALAGGN